MRDAVGVALGKVAALSEIEVRRVKLEILAMVIEFGMGDVEAVCRLLAMDPQNAVPTLGNINISVVAYAPLGNGGIAIGSGNGQSDHRYGFECFAATYCSRGGRLTKSPGIGPVKGG